MKLVYYFLIVITIIGLDVRAQDDELPVDATEDVIPSTFLFESDEAYIPQNEELMYPATEEMLQRDQYGNPDAPIEDFEGTEEL